MASISKQSKETQDRHRKMLIDILKRPENHECMDCRARNPTWASTNLGVFVCIRCSGLHRQVGVHITKVKSCTMDLWDPEQIAFIQTMGNGRGKAIYEALLPPDYGKPAESEDSQLVLQWIRTKYEKKRYFSMTAAATTVAPTVATTNDKNASANASCDVMALPRAKPRKPKQQQSQQIPNNGGDLPPASPSSPPPEHYTFDQFMSPAIQSPRGGANEFGGGSGGESAFSFLNNGDAQQQQQYQQPSSVTSTGASSGFAFINTTTTLTEDGGSNDTAAATSTMVDEAYTPSPTGSAFAFISSPAVAQDPSEAPSSPSALLPTQSIQPQYRELPKDSLLQFNDSTNTSSSVRQPGEMPPPIPGHFMSPVVRPPGDGGIVFDPFGHLPTTTTAASPVTDVEQQSPSSPQGSSSNPPPPAAAVVLQQQQTLPFIPQQQQQPTAQVVDPNALLAAMQQQMMELQQRLAAAAIQQS